MGKPLHWLDIVVSQVDILESRKSDVVDLWEHVDVVEAYFMIEIPKRHSYTFHSTMAGQMSFIFSFSQRELSDYGWSTQFDSFIVEKGVSFFGDRVGESDKVKNKHCKNNNNSYQGYNDS